MRCIKLLLVGVAFACSGSSNDKQDKPASTNISYQNPDTCILDLSIVSVAKIDDDSLIKRNWANIKDTSKYKWTISEFDEGIFFLNIAKDEYLKLSQTLSSGGDVFNYFEVGYKNDKKNKKVIYNNSTFNDFKTESGVHLGMSKENLLKLKGRRATVKHIDGFEVLLYKINDFKQCRYVPNGNSYSFELKYFFKNGVLSRFEFGYPIP